MTSDALTSSYYADGGGACGWLLRAGARGDEAEVQRLRDLEPARTFELRGPHFFFRLIAFDNLVRSFYADAAPWLGQLELLDELRDPRTGAAIRRSRSGPKAWRG